MTAADWSELPNDLLNLISKRINNDLDLIRFRSVCSPWRRSSISNKHHQLILPLKLPPFNNLPPRYLFKYILFLIKPPPPQQEEETPLRPWLIRITQNPRGKTQLFHPLLSGESPPPYHFPYVLDFNKFSDVVFLGTDFVIDWDKEPLPTPEAFHVLPTPEGFHQLMLPRPEGFHRLMLRHERRALRKKGVIVSNQRLEKVAAVTCGGKNPLALGTLNHEGHPILFHCREERWTQIPCMSTHFMDICEFKDRIYAVNKIGRTVAFGPHYSIQLVAEYVDGGDMKFLVESEGELLLVDIYDSHCFGFPGEDGLKLDVFRLDEKEKEWVKLTSLGDRILFLGNGCSFSASASDLSVAKGNCVIFIDEAFHCFDDMACGMCVFHLDQCRLSLLSDYPEYLSLFGPPPEWVINMLQGP